MAHRIRTIKPEMWSSEDVLSLSLTGQLTWVVLISIADDEGRIKTNPQHLHDAYMRKADPDEIRIQLQQMEDQEMIVQYAINGRRYIQILSWERHQKVSHPKSSSHPSPMDSGAVRNSPEISGAFGTSPVSRAPADPIRSDPIRSDHIPDPRAGAREDVKKEPDYTSGEIGTSGGMTTNGTNEVSELLAGYQQVTGNEPMDSDAVTAGDFIAELGRRLSVSKMVERMRSHVEWCDEHGQERPRSLKRFWTSLRKEADHEVDVAAGHANRSHSNGFTSAGDVLASQQEEDPF